MKIFLIVAIGLGMLPAHAIFRVGNGGEGIRQGQGLYLRDLFEANLHLHPYIGEPLDPYFETEVKRSTVSHLSLPLNLLARKLTHIQSLSPQLGHYTLAAINAYQWILVDEPLLPFEDDGSPVKLPVRIPMANRFQNTILLQRETWTQLTPEHQVALILHEAIYGMTKPLCDNSLLCVQPAYKAREIVARLFSNETTPNKAFSEIVRQVLTMPDWPVSSCVHGSHRLQVQLNVKNGYWPFTRMSLRKFELSDARDREERLRFLQNICAQEWAPVKSRATITVRMSRDPFQAFPRTYSTLSSGSTYEQIYVDFDVQGSLYEPISGESWATLNQTQCASAIDDKAQLWYSRNPALDERVSIDACERR